ncbi:MAG: hypothetical protein B7Z22_00080 [Hyphomonas sp. 32-62-5]|nr:MAG: hypothetical protein B7Z22_00080 [Hyphomonas sp. 32-62-5]
MSQELSMLRLLMRPSNAVCDAMGIKNENERGMVRMLVNMLLLTILFVFLFVATVGSYSSQSLSGAPLL